MTNDGPYLAMAVLCEKVLTEADGTLSIIRVVDRITQNVALLAGAAVPPVTVSIFVVLAFKSGGARGSHKIGLRPETPAGLTQPETSTSVLFEGEDRGVNVVLNLTNLQLDQEGLYWFDVLVDDVMATRIPLRVVRQRLSVGPTPIP